MARRVRLVLTEDDKVQFRLTVAYAKEVVGSTCTRLFMLSVYIRCYERLTRTEPEHDENTQWVLAERTYEPRTISEVEQLAILNALAYKAALNCGKDYTVVVEALPKKPKLEKKHGFQRPKS